MIIEEEIVESLLQYGIQLSNFLSQHHKSLNRGSSTGFKREIEQIKFACDKSIRNNRKKI